MQWYLARAPQGVASLGDADLYRKLVYWWACEQAPSLNIEDCLVSRFHIDYLRQIPTAWMGKAFPLSHFMEEALATHPILVSFGPMQGVSARLTAYMTLAAHALDEPGLLRFVPETVIDRLFGGSKPLFDDLAAAACAEHPAAQPLDTKQYRASLAQRGFDLDTLAFRSVDKTGHRSEAARLGAVAPGPPVDVQLIGPLNKVSGIAHATRLSQTILQSTGYSLAFTQCSLDNSQPDQPTPIGTTGYGVNARVNLIHLNAEMLPLAYAYMPDIHDKAYTIGFFFWELDRPADCHRLGLDLVDEVWVASEYNRHCFAAWTDKPVVNVGMAIDIDRVPDREAARLELERMCGAGPQDFVFLTSYDSSSYVLRKNPLSVLRAFQAAFPGDEPVRLVIKTHNAASIAEGLGRRVWDEILQAASEDQRLIVIDQTLPYAKMMALKAGSDCYVSLHRSEGLGFGLLEAMKLNVPVVCTGYSGNLDFCDDTTAWLVAADEIGVRPGDYAHVSPGHRWAEPRHGSAAAALQGVKEDMTRRQERVTAAAARIADRYSIEAAAKRYSNRLGAILASRTAFAAEAGSTLPSPSVEPHSQADRRKRFLSLPSLGRP
jgi:glycosyltransferase involved in cell wall biosynthesis